MALLLVLLTCLAPRLRRPLPPTYPADFSVYYTASLLVRQGKAAQMYTGADTGADPQKAIALPGTPIYDAARSQGLPFVGLYVYPPVLADLLLPFTLLPVAEATHLWLVTNILCLLVTGLLLIRLLEIRMLSLEAGVVLIFMFCFTPALQCLVDGQITIFLLLLWTAGTVLYKEDRVPAAAAVFALATAIKLTPALILFPFLIWRRWRFVGAFLASLLSLALISLWMDTPYAFATYFRRVLPAMSGAIPYFTNYSLPAATQRLVTLLRSGNVAPFPAAMPTSTVLAGRAAAVCVLVVLLALIARAGRSLSKANQVIVLAMLSVVAPILSPVSWFHAYATSLLAFAVLWSRCFVRHVSVLYLLGLTAVSLLLGSAVSENLTTWLIFSGGSPALPVALQIGQLLLAAALVFSTLWQMRGEEGSVQVTVP